MKILDSSVAYDAATAFEKRNQGGRYDHAEKKIIVRFEKGIDFNTFDEFREVFLSLLKPSAMAHGKRQMDRLGSSPARAQVGAMKEGGFEIGIPEDMLDFATLNAKIGREA